MKIFTFMLLLLFLVCSMISCSKNNNSTITDEIKRKELELMEKELELKEKEILKEKMLKKKITLEEAKLFVENWAALQSNKALSAYFNLYSQDFQGIKRTSSGKIYYYNLNEWRDDKTKICSRNKYLYVSGTNITITGFDDTNGETKVQFTQYYSSDNYSDEGAKILHLTKDENGNIKILKEEMIYANEIIEGC